MTGAGWDFAMPLALALLPLPLAAFALRRPRGATPGALRVPAAVVARQLTRTSRAPA